MPRTAEPGHAVWDGRWRRHWIWAALLVGALTACAETSNDSGDPAEGTSAPSATTTTAEPTEPETSPSGGTGLRAALLPAGQLPGLNAETGWRERRTVSGERDPPAWVCQRVSLVANGAIKSVQRTFAATAGRATAAEVVARFADVRSSSRAYGALLGNARDCASALVERDRVPVGQVRPLTALDVPIGTAAWGVVFSGPVPRSRVDAFIDAVVVVRVRDLVAVTSMSSIGQDYNYEPGQAPPEIAGPLVADLLAARG